MTAPFAPIEVTGVSRSFGARKVVSNVSFQVAPGEVVGLLGPNGAGKTTTLRMLAGLLTPHEGHARLMGLDVHQQPLEARQQLGFLTASTGLYDRLTGREVLQIFGGLYGMTRAAIISRIAHLTVELDLDKFIDLRCSALSSGQKQRISIARAVMHDPPAYVLDEPTAMLDPLASVAILEMVKRASDRGKAVLFSTHRMEEAEFLCSRLLFMREGELVAEGSSASLKDQSKQGTLTGAFLHFARKVSAAKRADTGTAA